jgi:hypothetical protein
MLKWLAKKLNIQHNGGERSIQIGNVTGNVIVQHGVCQDELLQERARVEALMPKVPWPPIRDFMDRTFNTRQVKALNEHQLYRLRRYVETVIQNRENARGSK